MNLRCCKSLNSRMIKLSRFSELSCSLYCYFVRISLIVMHPFDLYTLDRWFFAMSHFKILVIICLASSLEKHKVTLLYVTKTTYWTELIFWSCWFMVFHSREFHLLQTDERIRSLQSEIEQLRKNLSESGHQIVCIFLRFFNFQVKYL